MKTIIPRWAIAACISMGLSFGVAAQTPARAAMPTAVVEGLFAAMQVSDTTATRAAFAPNARLIPVQAGDAVQNMTVDQFVAFAGKNVPGGWVERVWKPTECVSGALAELWFEYDVYRTGKFDHCGVNAVQLQQTTTGWKIVTMAFTSSAQACALHDPPPTVGARTR